MMGNDAETLYGQRTSEGIYWGGKMTDQGREAIGMDKTPGAQTTGYRPEGPGGIGSSPEENQSAGRREAGRPAPRRKHAAEGLRYICRRVSFWAALALTVISGFVFSAQADMAWRGMAAELDALRLAREYGAPFSRIFEVFGRHLDLLYVPMFSLVCLIFGAVQMIRSFRRSRRRRFFSLLFSIGLTVWGWALRPSFLGQPAHQGMMIPLYILIAVWLIDCLAPRESRNDGESAPPPPSGHYFARNDDQPRDGR